MSANQSSLSSAHYGYDFVVATTQASINATMKEFLSGLTEPEVAICYVADEQGNPTAIDYDTLVKNANGSDPFSVPNGADLDTNQDLKNLFAARFMVGFKAQIGLPPGIAPQDMPDIVTLGANTASVSYNLMCAEFIVVQYTPKSGYSPASWMNESQPAGSPWIFNSKVDLRLTTTDQSDYSKLPPDVQKQIKNLGGDAFSVQQLLFDLDNAALESIPTMSGVAPGTTLYEVLQRDFLGKYFTTVQENGQPVLGAAIRQSSSDPSTLVLTDLNMEVNPFVGSNGEPVFNPTKDQQDLSTLDYLCAANGNSLPTASEFTWNWIDPSQESDFQGVVAINRNILANYFKDQLEPFVKQNCFLPHVRVWLSGKLDTTVNYESSLTGSQTPTVTNPTTGAEVLHFSYSNTSWDQAGADGWMGKMRFSPSLEVSVSFTGNKIVIVQHLVIYIYVRVLTISDSGNIVDITITDTYTLSVDQTGKLEYRRVSTTHNDSKDPSVSGFLNFWTGVNDLIASLEDWTKKFTSVTFRDIPLSTARSFIFPGGKTFIFKGVAFSEYQDLVSHITYIQPS